MKKDPEKMKELEQAMELMKDPEFQKKVWGTPSLRNHKLGSNICIHDGGGPRMSEGDPRTLYTLRLNIQALKSGCAEDGFK